MAPISIDNEVPLFLQRTSDRDRLVDRFLNDLTYPSEEFPDEPLNHPEWGAVYTVGAHLAVKHRSRQDFFRNAGDADYNIYRVPASDLITVLTLYDDLVVKTGAYPNATERLLRYEGYEHELNDSIVPQRAVETRFLTVVNYGDGPELQCVHTYPDSTVTDDNIVEDIDVTLHDVTDLPELLEDATTLYTDNSMVVPSNLDCVEPNRND